MKRVGLALSTGLLAAGALSGCAKAPNPANNDPRHEQMIREISDYWRTMGVTDLGNVTLRTLLKGEEAECSGPIASTDEWKKRVVRPGGSSPAYYCAGEDAIIIDAGKFAAWRAKAQAEGISPEATDAVIFHHELGHAVTDAIATLEAKVSHELWADCFAGQSLSNVSPDLLPDAQRVYESQEIFAAESPSHGSRTERAESFYRGVEGVYGCGGVPVNPPQA